MITQVLQTIRATFKETKRNTEEIYKSQISNIQTNLHHWKSSKVLYSLIVKSKDGYLLSVKKNNKWRIETRIF